MPFGERSSILGAFSLFEGNGRPRFSLRRTPKVSGDGQERGGYSRCNQRREETRPLSLYDNCEECWKSGDKFSASSDDTTTSLSSSTESSVSFPDDRSAKSLIPCGTSKRIEPHPRRCFASNGFGDVVGALPRQPKAVTLERIRRDARGPHPANREVFTSPCSQRRPQDGTSQESSRIPQRALQPSSFYENVALRRCLQPEKDYREVVWTQNDAYESAEPPKSPKLLYISEMTSVSLDSRSFLEEKVLRGLLTEYPTSDSDTVLDSTLTSSKWGGTHWREAGSNLHRGTASSLSPPWRYSQSFWNSHGENSHPGKERRAFPNQDPTYSSLQNAQGWKASDASCQSATPLTNYYHLDYSPIETQPSTSSDEYPRTLNTVVFRNSRYDSTEETSGAMCIPEESGSQLEYSASDSEVGSPDYNPSRKRIKKTTRRDGSTLERSGKPQGRRTLPDKRQRKESSQSEDTEREESASSRGHHRRRRRRKGTRRKVSFQSPVFTLVSPHGQGGPPQSSTIQGRHAGPKPQRHPGEGSGRSVTVRAEYVDRHPRSPRSIPSFPVRGDVDTVGSQRARTSCRGDSGKDLHRLSVADHSARKGKEEAVSEGQEIKRKLRSVWNGGLFVLLVTSVCVEVAAVITGHWAISTRDDTDLTCGPVFVCRDQVCEPYPDGVWYLACGLASLALGLLLQMLAACSFLHSALRSHSPHLYVHVSLFASGVFILAGVAFFWHNLQRHCGASRETLSGEDVSLLTLLAMAAFSGATGLAGMLWRIVSAYARLCGAILQPHPVTSV